MAIVKQYKVTISKDAQATTDYIYVYQHDRGVDLQFSIIDMRELGNGFRGDILKGLSDMYSTITIVKPDSSSFKSEKLPIVSGKVLFTITEELTDELTEIGMYTLQIHLHDIQDNRITIPEVQFEVKELISDLDCENTGAVAGYSRVGMTEVASEQVLFTFTRGYGKTTWATGDKITAVKLNNLETGLETVTAEVEQLKASGGGTGTQGPKGDKGDTGATPNISIGSVVTLAPGQNATVTKTGTAEAPVLNFAIPKGDKGDTGTGGSGGIDPNSHTHANKTVLDGITEQKVAEWDTNKGNYTEYKLKSKNYLAIGDSITAKTIRSTKNYHEFISDITKCVVTNYGKDGWTIARMVNEITKMPVSADLITLFMGTNDWDIGTLPLGSFGDTGITSVYGTINTMLTGLVARYPVKSILVFSPLPRYSKNQYGLNAPNNSLGFTLLNVVDALKITCEHYSIPFLDLYRCSGFYLYNPTVRIEYFPDGLHPNEKGHEELADRMLSFIEENMKVLNLNPAVTIFGEIVPSKVSTTIVEGSTDTFTVKLDKAPTNNQTVTLSKTNADVTLSKTSLTFTPSNYNVAQSITITVAEDPDYSNENDTVTLTSPNVNTKTIAVTITDNDTPPTNVPVQSVSLDKKTHTLKVDETVQLNPTIIPSDATNQSITWSCNNANAQVTQQGLVTATVEGEAIITVNTQDQNKSDSCTLTIQAKDTFVGKTINVTGVKSHPFNFTTVIQSDNLQKGASIEIKYKLSNGGNVVDASSDSMQLFGATGSGVSDSKYSGTYSSHTQVDVSWIGSVAQGTCTYITSANVATPFLRIPLPIDYAVVPISFKIEQLEVKVNGVLVNIENVGGFFTQETFTLI